MMAPDDTVSDAPISTQHVHARACDLPLKQDVPLQDRAVDKPRKSIHDTLGSKLTHFLIYYVLGFAANSALSVGITYYVMPRDRVKTAKDAMAEGIKGVFKNSKDPKRAALQTIEILIMMVAGTILTACMAPLVNHREQIAHWINKKIGRDADVLPDDQKKLPAPRTLEERIEQEITKRVNKHHTSNDLWKARWTGLTVPLVGNFILSNWNSKRENVPRINPATGLKDNWRYEKWSVDTKVWEAGGKFYDKVLSKKSWVNKLSNFLEGHGAGIKDMERNAPESFNVLKAIEDPHNTGVINKSRVMVAEQGRMLTKEVGWTIILAGIIDMLVGAFYKHRVKKEQQKAIADLTKEGFVPDGYKIVLDEGVKLERVGGKKWAEKNPPKPRLEKSESFVAAADKSRAGIAEQQPAL
jgi:hypothetical protein